MMKRMTGSAAAFVIRPEVISAMAYLVLVRIWSMWMLCTFRYPPRGATEPATLITSAQFAGLSIINVAFCAAFLLAAFRCRTSHPSVRRGHLVGLALGFLAVVLVQVGATFAHSPITRS